MRALSVVNPSWIHQLKLSICVSVVYIKINMNTIKFSCRKSLKRRVERDITCPTAIPSLPPPCFKFFHFQAVLGNPNLPHFLLLVLLHSEMLDVLLLLFKNLHLLPHPEGYNVDAGLLLMYQSPFQIYVKTVLLMF